MTDQEILGAAMAYTDKHGGGGGGTTNYNQLENKPQINGTTLVGNKTASQLGLASTADLADKADKTDVKNEFIGTTDEWNALTTEQKKAYDTYQITDDFISGGGSGFVQQELYTGTSAVSTYALADNISNYDLIYVYSSNSGKYDCTSIFRSDDVLATIEDSTLKLGVFNDSEYEYFRATAENALASVQKSNRFITKIIGFKFVGSSSGGSGDGTKFKSKKYVGTGTTSHTIDFGGETPKQILSITIDPDDYAKSGLQYLTKVENIAWGDGYATGYFITNNGDGTPQSLYGGSTTRNLKLEYSGNVLIVTASDAENALNQNGISYIVNYLV